MEKQYQCCGCVKGKRNTICVIGDIIDLENEWTLCRVIDELLNFEKHDWALIGVNVCFVFNHYSQNIYRCTKYFGFINPLCIADVNGDNNRIIGNTLSKWRYSTCLCRTFEIEYRIFILFRKIQMVLYILKEDVFTLCIRFYFFLKIKKTSIYSDAFSHGVRLDKSC